jgi:hypothetical protein
MKKDLFVVTYPGKMANDEENFKKFKASIGLMFKEFGRDVDLIFLPEGIDIRIVKGAE